MRTRPICFVALVFAMASPLPAIAADADGRFALRSFGSLSCGQVVEAINSRKDDNLQTLVDQLSFWLGGYLTHANRVTPEAFDIVPFAVERDVLAVVVNRCQASTPETNFEAVTANVVNSLSSFAVEGQSPIRTGDMMIPLREMIVVLVQEKLILLGHLKGKADGVFGENSVKAVQEFQLSRNSAATGRLDIDTVLALLAS